MMAVEPKLQSRRALVAVAGAVLAGPACGVSSHERTEPPLATWACVVADRICQQAAGPTVVDGTDPLWNYCHSLAPNWLPSAYSPGAAEFWFTYHPGGELDRIDLRCDDDGPGLEFAAIAERDDADRVVRWAYTTPERGGASYPATELAYDTDGMIVESATRIFDDDGDEISGLVRAYEYRDDGNVLQVRGQSTFMGIPTQLGSMTWDLEYDEALLVRAVATSLLDDCDLTFEYEYDGGRLTRMVQSGTCVGWEGRREYIYDWSGDRLVRGRFVLDTPQGDADDDLRYAYEEGRIAEVQWDRGGQPLATYWFDYDEEGRLAHLLWWGHHPDPDVRR